MDVCYWKIYYLVIIWYNSFYNIVFALEQWKQFNYWLFNNYVLKVYYADDMRILTNSLLINK
jgi:hypothetical protein